MFIVEWCAVLKTVATKLANNAVHVQENSNLVAPCSCSAWHSGQLFTVLRPLRNLWMLLQLLIPLCSRDYIGIAEAPKHWI